MSDILRFKKEVEDGIIMMSWNGLQKLSAVVSGITQKLIELNDQKWKSDESLIKEKFWTYLAIW